MNTERIEELKTRIQRDPASIAFAQLGEEYRRAGRFQEAIDTCRAGLARHPDYLSARVTVGRSLMALGDLPQATAELREVLRIAPENLSALRGLADLARLGGDNVLARVYLEQAAAIAPRDLELQQQLQALRDEAMPRTTRNPLPGALSPGTREQARELAAALAGARPDPARTRLAIAALERWRERIRVASH